MAYPEIRPIRIDGNVAYITLTKGFEACIDAADIPLIDGWNWHAKLDAGRVYAARSEKRNFKSVIVYLHRTIANPPCDMHVDHIDGDGLNNRRNNLRHATLIENNRNRRISKNNTTGFKGVSWRKKDNMWLAQIDANKHTIKLGSFSTPEAAHAAYTKASLELHGRFAKS